MTSPMREHLLSRGCSPEKYRVWIDNDNGVAVFPLYDSCGKWYGYQQYRPSGTKYQRANVNPKEMRYFTKVPRNKVTMFGIEQFDWSKATVFVVEGVFDAITIHNLGFNAIALLSNNPKIARSALTALGKTTVAVLDGDKAGKALASVCDKAIVCPEGHDAASMNKEQLLQLLTEACNV